MAKGGNPKNLIPQNKRTKEEQSRIARMGGKKSGEVRREKILMSKVYAEILADKSKIDLEGDGHLKDMTGVELVKEVSKRILMAGGSPAVSLIKELREGTEGSRVNLAGDLNVVSTSEDLADEFNAIKAAAEKRK